MNLSKKTFTYSSIMAACIVVIVLGYFILMLPSLYVNYMERLNYDSIKEVQKVYLRDRCYKNVKSRNPTSTCTVSIPKNKDEIKVENALGTIDVIIYDQDIKNILNEGRKIFSKSFDGEKLKDSEFDKLKECGNKIKEKMKSENQPIKIETYGNNGHFKFEKESSKVSTPSDNMFIYESKARDKHNFYTTYFAFSQKDDAYIISILPVMTPEIGEIRGIVLQSMPVITVIIVLIILAGTIFFSRRIVNSIESLAHHASYIKENPDINIEPLEISGSDEIAQLSNTLNEMYAKLNDNFNELKNQNERQKVFLRASSHQLKTPVAAALLLVDSMINEIGKFKNTKEYLPKLREQLISIKKLVDEILNINAGEVRGMKEKVKINDMIMDIVRSREIEMEKRKISVRFNNNEIVIKSINSLLYKVIDNLINNAVKYSNDNGYIDIRLNEECLEIINYGSRIPDDILPHIFEAFVSGADNTGHGLGLYIVSYYCKILKYRVNIENIENGVKYTLYFHK